MLNDHKMSENVGRYEAGEYYVTAGTWQPDRDFGPSYEIGIRHKASGKFHLLQNRNFNFQSVQEVANAIAHLIGDAGESYDPEWCIEWFGREGS